MTPHLDIAAGELAMLAAQTRYLALAASCLHDGPPVDPLERTNGMLTLLQVIEDLAARAEAAACGLQAALEAPAWPPPPGAASTAL